MALRRNRRIGALVILLATVTYLLISRDVGNATTTSLTGKLLSNLNHIRCSLAERGACLAEACADLASVSAAQFYEIVFQKCLSPGGRVAENSTNLKKPMLHMVVVACGDRLEETLVNIKSSMLFTTVDVFYHIFAEDALHDGFNQGILKWPVSYRKNLRYKLYPITFPDDGNNANWKKLFKPCASQRLFLPMVLGKDIDSVIYVDTDILFLSDVKEFWNFFHEFNSTQISSLCTEHEDKRMGWYNRFARHPYYGPTGINSGIMLMNLTGMRNARYKNDLLPTKMTWHDMLLPLYKKYKLNITWGDQDLLNIVFHHNPEMLHVFSCKWNYRPDHCMYGQLCKVAANEGVKIVHGSRGVYHSEKQPTFKAVYEAVRKYDFQGDLWASLYEPMQLGLRATEHTYCGKEHGCILKGLELAIKKKLT